MKSGVVVVGCHRRVVWVIGLAVYALGGSSAQAGLVRRRYAYRRSFCGDTGIQQLVTVGGQRRIQHLQVAALQGKAGITLR